MLHAHACCYAASLSTASSYGWLCNAQGHSSKHLILLPEFNLFSLSRSTERSAKSAKALPKNPKYATCTTYVISCLHGQSTEQSAVSIWSDNSHCLQEPDITAMHSLLNSVKENKIWQFCKVKSQWHQTAIVVRFHCLLGWTSLCWDYTLLAPL